MHAVGRQPCGECGVDFAGADKKRGVCGGDEQMRQEHRVVGHIAAAQVGDPGDVVHGRHQVRARTFALHGRTHGGELGGAGARGMRHAVFVHRLRGQGGAVAPDGIDDIEVGAQAAAGFLKGSTQLQGRAKGQHLAVAGDDGA